jgi:hypothetical protein
MSAICVSGWPPRQQVDTLPITKRRGNLAFPKNKAFTLANEDSPAYLPGAFELAVGSLAAVPRITESFRSGLGMGWHEHTDGVFHGCEKFSVQKTRFPVRRDTTIRERASRPPGSLQYISDSGKRNRLSRAVRCDHIGRR